MCWKRASGRLTSTLPQNRMSDPGDKDSLVPPSPYPATVDPSPVESTNSTSTEATDIEVDDEEARTRDLGKEHNEDIISPATDERVLPARPHSQELVCVRLETCFSCSTR